MLRLLFRCQRKKSQRCNSHNKAEKADLENLQENVSLLDLISVTNNTDWLMARIRIIALDIKSALFTTNKNCWILTFIKQGEFYHWKVTLESTFPQLSRFSISQTFIHKIDCRERDREVLSGRSIFVSIVEKYVDKRKKTIQNFSPTQVKSFDFECDLESIVSEIRNSFECQVRSKALVKVFFKFYTIELKVQKIVPCFTFVAEEGKNLFPGLGRCPPSLFQKSDSLLVNNQVTRIKRLNREQMKMEH